MGSASSKKQPTTTVARSKTQPRLTSLSEKISPSISAEEAQALELSFHKALLTKLPADAPLTSSQLQKALQTEYLRLFKGYELPIPSVLAKLKAKECFYHYINDRHSYDFYVRLKRRLVKDLLEGILTESQAVNQYKAEAKGTFMMQGLDEISEIAQLHSTNPTAVHALLETQEIRDLELLAESGQLLQDLPLSEAEAAVLDLLALQAPKTVRLNRHPEDLNSALNLPTKPRRCSSINAESALLADSHHLK